MQLSLKVYTCVLYRNGVLPVHVRATGGAPGADYPANPGHHHDSCTARPTCRHDSWYSLRSGTLCTQLDVTSLVYAQVQCVRSWVLRHRTSFVGTLF